MKLTLAGLRSVDMETLRPFAGDSEWLYASAGVEHHRLLAYLSTLFKGRTIFDIGTHHGDSAHALSYNEANQVLSFDVVNHVPGHRRSRQNITYHQADLFDLKVRGAWKQKLLKSAIVFLDIDPHEGSREYELIGGCAITTTRARGPRRHLALQADAGSSVVSDRRSATRSMSRTSGTGRARGSSRSTTRSRARAGTEPSTRRTGLSSRATSI